MSGAIPQAPIREAPILEARGLTKRFGKQLIWGDVSLTVPAGEICVMLGPSGTGKSVFLKTMIGLLKRKAEKVIVDTALNGLKARVEG